MLPTERALQEELRREAVQVRIPDDMWGNISRQLDAERAATEKRRLQRNVFQKKSALALAAAAGIFWIMAMPADLIDSQVEGTEPFSVVAPAHVRPQENVPWEDIRSGPKPIRPADRNQANPLDRVIVTPR